MEKKIMLIILDGLGDESSLELGGTPLEYISRELKTMNYMVQNGLCGMLYPIAPGIPPASDTGHLSIFGYDLKREYPGRGYFEALGAGIRPSEGEIAFRVNLATVKKVNNKLIVLDRRAGRISGEEAEFLYEALDRAIREKGIHAKILHTLEHRGVLIIREEDGIGAITDTDPHETMKPLMAATPWPWLDNENKKKAEKVARVVNEISKLAFEILDGLDKNRERRGRGLPPANAILVRGGGLARNITPFEQKWGLKSAFIAAGALYKGVARALGMTEIPVEGITGTPKTNLKGKIEGALKAIDMGYDFVYLHIKGTDNLSHDKKPLEKAKFIQKIDVVMRPLLDLDNVVVAVTGDHTTSSIRGRHMGLPVPLLVWSKEIRRDSISRFGEDYCRKGGLGFLTGGDLMRVLMDLANRSVEDGTYPSKQELLLV